MLLIYLPVDDCGSGMSGRPMAVYTIEIFIFVFDTKNWTKPVRVLTPSGSSASPLALVARAMRTEPKEDCRTSARDRSVI